LFIDDADIFLSHCSGLSTPTPGAKADIYRSVGNNRQTKVNHQLLTTMLASGFAFLLTVAFLKGVFRNRSVTVTSARKVEGFDDLVQRNPDGTFELKAERQATRARGIQRMREEAEQYVLLAKDDGYYECAHCPQGRFYLYKGEIAKVGTTLRKEGGRYTQKFYNTEKLQYITEYRGSKQEAEEREFLRIVDYPLLAENLSRPDQPEGGVERFKLGRPPQNPVDR
jgi:hypothetical protein